MMETYTGHVRTPNDAIILFEACRMGLLPRVQRRLSEKERQQIKSGSVFVWDEREAGMRRWTDGKSWSASRVSGSFLTYREMEGKRGGSGFTPSGQNGKKSSGNSAKTSDADDDMGDDGPDGYRYKPDGLMKQSFSITTTQGQHLHLISYYARSQATAQPLKQPSNDPALRHIRPQKGMYPESTLGETNTVPAVTRGPMPGSPYAQAHPMGMGSPYATHPQGYVPVPPGYVPAGWPVSPIGTPPAPAHFSPYHQPVHYPPGQSPMMYPHPGYPHQPYPAAPPQTQFDRPPRPITRPDLLPPPPQPPSAQAQEELKNRLYNGLANAGANGVSNGQHPQLAAMGTAYGSQPTQPGQVAQIPPNPYGSSMLDSRAQATAPPTSQAYPAPQIQQTVATPTPSAPPAANGESAPSPHYPSSAAPAVQPPTSDSLAVPDRAAATTGSTPPSRTIPNINALINGNATEDATSEKSVSRAGSKSPGSMQRNGVNGGPLPGEKEAFGEDKRAISQLNKVFK